MEALQTADRGFFIALVTFTNEKQSFKEQTVGCPQGKGSESERFERLGQWPKAILR
jgi:hypothetical protein